MKEKLLKIINHYGINNQQRKLEEEVFELQESIIEYEIAKERNKYGDTFDLTYLKERISEELADVQVLLDQIRYYYEIRWERTSNIQLIKADRQLERINNE